MNYVAWAPTEAVVSRLVEIAIDGRIVFSGFSMTPVASLIYAMVRLYGSGANISLIEDTSNVEVLQC